MAPPPKALEPFVSARHFLGTELRRWRELRGLSSVQLAARVFVSASLVQKVECAERAAHAQVIEACDAVLDTGGALGRLLAFIEHTEQAGSGPEQAAGVVVPIGAAQVLIRVVAELVPGGPDMRAAAGSGGGSARLYALPGGGSGHER
ncbi:helix-turn-helix domain-containing protein [Dactylosporangium sp. CA-092794]|uniref:helix-turn-helix domain-containing protein n=1 Tax=Dactylosporangium sp. CA-092794 TaxID=3239929 RepID=UPI003D8CDBC4